MSRFTPHHLPDLPECHEPADELADLIYVRPSGRRLGASEVHVWRTHYGATRQLNHAQLRAHVDRWERGQHG